MLLATQSHKRLRNGSWSGGGPFYVDKNSFTFEYGPILYWKKNGVIWNDYLIPLVGSSPPVLPNPASWSSERTTLAGKYATGYKKARPGNPVADVGQFVYELHDLPRIPLDLARRAKEFFVGSQRIASAGGNVNRHPAKPPSKFEKKAADEYLNWEFGWKPFINDLKKMYKLYTTLDQKLDKLRRENGRNIHRRATIDKSREHSFTQTNTAMPFVGYSKAPPYWTGGTTTKTVETSTTESSWFSGSFRYFIEDPYSDGWTRRATLALFGALPTPALIWECLPWSWLIDWFGNAGDVLSNMSMNAVDNHVCNYSYVMRHTKVVTRTTYLCEWNQLGSPGTSTWIPKGNCRHVCESIHETKSRVGGGNPYGLDFQLASLSGRQAAILTALGISKGHVR